LAWVRDVKGATPITEDDEVVMKVIKPNKRVTVLSSDED
jgi:hypothetical protein